MDRNQPLDGASLHSDCSQACQMLQECRRLNLRVETDEHGYMARLTKDLKNFLSVEIRHAKVHQDNIRPLVFYLLHIAQRSDSSYIREPTKHSFGRRVCALLFQSNGFQWHASSSLERSSKGYRSSLRDCLDNAWTVVKILELLSGPTASKLYVTQPPDRR
jgi:hypothetical protein